MRLERLGEARALANLLADLGERALELLVLDLLDERVERLEERDAGADQRGELAREHRDVGGGGAPQELEELDVPLGLGFGNLALGGDREEHAVLAQRAPQGLRVLGVADALHRFAGADEDASILEDGHDPSR